MNSKGKSSFAKVMKKVIDADIKRNSWWPICFGFLHQPKRPEEVRVSLKNNVREKDGEENEQK